MLPVFVALQFKVLRARQRLGQGVGAVARGDRELAAAAVKQHRQFDHAGAAEVEQLVEGGARGTTGEQHVVDQDHVRAIDVEGDLGALRFCMQALAGVVVAVEGDVDCAQRLGDAELGMQALGQPQAAGVDADQRGGGRDMRAHLCGELLAQRFGIKFGHDGGRPERFAG